VEVMTGMLPIAGGLQRLPERVGRGRASRFAMLGEPIPGSLAGQLGIATHVVREAELPQAVEAMAQKLAVGPTKSYTATRTLLKAWSAGGVAAADTVLLDISMDLFNTEDVTRGFLNTSRGHRPRRRAAGHGLQQPLRRARPSLRFRSWTDYAPLGQSGSGYRAPISARMQTGIMIRQVQFWESCEAHMSEKSPFRRLTSS
jgi:hypothetical protein